MKNNPKKHTKCKFNQKYDYEMININATRVTFSAEKMNDAKKMSLVRLIKSIEYLEIPIPFFSMNSTESYGTRNKCFFLFRLLLFRFITRLYVKELIRTLTHAIWFTYASHSIQYRNKIVNPMWTYSILFCSPSSYRCIDGPATNKHVKGKNLYTKQTNYINVKFHRRRRRRRRCYGWAVCCCFEFFLFSFFEKDRNKYHANISSLVYSQLIPIFYAKSATVLFSQTNSRIMTKNCQLQTNATFSGAQ